MIYPSTPDFLEYVLEMLSFIDNPSFKRMFSGYAIYSNEVHFAVIIDNILYMVVKDVDLQASLLTQGSMPFSYSRNDRVEPIVVKSWLSVPDEALEQPEVLQELVCELFPDICAM